MTTVPVLCPATPDEFKRIVERAATDPDRAPVLCPATHEEFMRILGRAS